MPKTDEKENVKNKEPPEATEEKAPIVPKGGKDQPPPIPTRPVAKRARPKPITASIDEGAQRMKMQEVVPLKIPTIEATMDNEAIKRIFSDPAVELSVKTRIDAIKSAPVIDAVIASPYMKPWIMAINNAKSMRDLSKVVMLCGEEDINMPFLLAVNQLVQEKGAEIRIKTGKRDEAIPNLENDIKASENNLRSAMEMEKQKPQR